MSYILLKNHSSYYHVAICWVIAGVIALAANSEAKVIWTCVMGAALGLVGIRYTIRRDRRSGI